MPGLYAPGTSVRPLRLRVLRRVCRDLRSRHPCLLRPLRLHYLTQVPSAGPALTCEDGWHRAFIRGSVPEPERPSSLARTFVRPAPDAPVGLSARSAEDRKNDADASPFQTSSEPSGGICTRLYIVRNCTVFTRAEAVTEKYKYHKTAAHSRSGRLQAALSIMDYIQSYGLYGIRQIISYLRVAVECIIDVPLSYL